MDAIIEINNRALNFMQGRDEVLFSFETSLGEVVCKAILVDSTTIHGDKKYKIKNVDFEVLRGEGFLNDLYDGFIDIHDMDGWIRISLLDEYYGSPEYKIKLL